MENGNVGIGDNNPNATLSVGATKGTNAAYFRVQNTNDGSNLFVVNNLGGSGFSSTSSSGDMGIIFSTDGHNGVNENNGFVIAPWSPLSSNAGLKIMENGNVGIGTSLPT